MTSIAGKVPTILTLGLAVMESALAMAIGTHCEAAEAVAVANAPATAAAPANTAVADKALADARAVIA